MASKLPDNVLMIVGFYVVHGLHRVLFTALNEDEMIGDIFSSKYLSSLTSHYNRLYRVLRRIVFSELRIVRRPDIADATFAEWGRTIDDILQHTSLRGDTDMCSSIKSRYWGEVRQARDISVRPCENHSDVDQP